MDTFLGESVIQSIRDRQPTYNLITNNCQTYALQLLDAIKAGGESEFGTTLAIYERIVGQGKVADLFVTDAEEAELQQEHVFAPPGRQDTVLFAQQVMNDNTTQLDTEEELHKKQKKKKGGIFSRFTRS